MPNFLYCSEPPSSYSSLKKCIINVSMLWRKKPRYFLPFLDNAKYESKKQFGNSLVKQIMGTEQFTQRLCIYCMDSHQSAGFSQKVNAQQRIKQPYSPPCCFFYQYYNPEIKTLSGSFSVFFLSLQKLTDWLDILCEILALYQQMFKAEPLGIVFIYNKSVFTALNSN